MPTLTKSNKAVFVAAAIILLLMAFVQCYKTTHDLHFAFDVDFDRDIGFARGTMNGHYGEDPNYKGEYLWYNPMLFTIEAAISKWTSTPINVVVVRAGAYLNLLGPICFFLMAAYFFGMEVALGSLFAFLFVPAALANGGECYNYSPWLYPFCFAQFVFFIDMVLCYKAFLSQKYSWFIWLGVAIGLSFLAHAAPVILIILIMGSIQGRKILASMIAKSYVQIKKYFFQGTLCAIFFILAASPLLYYIVGKYHLHTINRSPMDYTDGMFYLSHYMEMIKENLSISFLVALIGFIWFYKNFHQQLIRRMIFDWLLFAIIMYIYASLVAYFDYSQYGIHLPGTVPSYHYYFYLKMVEWVFFGFGFVFLTKWLVNAVVGFLTKQKYQFAALYPAIIFSFLLLCLAIVMYPSYQKRPEFVSMRNLSLVKERDKNKVELYHFILKDIPEDKVILCEAMDTISLFPVMATARKTVAVAGTFSNPYVDFYERENDQTNMLLYLKNGEPVTAKHLFSKYDVDFVLLANKRAIDYHALEPMTGKIVFRNDGFVMYSIKKW
ncbi:MAG: hypothetical protein JST58_11895 [Bacteroidetes bacterium]|nr:hypothetical protein [Bacteroidota bacterium]